MEEAGVTNRCHIRIDRPIFENDQLRTDLNYQKSKSSCLSKACPDCGQTSVRKLILKTVPALKWLSHYKIRQNLLPDLISGFTVAIMHIPQGMAYALLGNVPPVVGIYMALFPVMIYFFLGTSRHNSMGTFAVVCLMTGKAVLEHSHPSYFTKAAVPNNLTDDNPIIEHIRESYSPIEVATAVTFTVALFQLAMYVLRLGAISALLSDTLVSGFTTGAAFQVITSQVKDLLGLQIPRQKGLFVVINTLKCVFEEISTVNYAALTISAITIAISSFNNELLKPLVAKKSSFPIPIELIAIVVGTVVSKYCNLVEDYGIQTVGTIPRTLPLPTAPPFSLITSVLLDGFMIAIVSYSVSLSMALIFAQKLNYEVDPNQELLAQGTGNLFGSFFSCMPFSASLSRSSIQQTVGGRSQIASVVSCTILVAILLSIGPFFEPLPKAVLASVIIVALKGMVMQVSALFRFWKLSKMDAFVWLVTFLSVVFVSIDIGLLIGVGMSLLSILVMSLKPYTCLLGNVPHTDIYMDINRYKGATEISGVKIFQYCGVINFATRNTFKSELMRLIQINPQKEIIYRRKITKYAGTVENNLEENEKVMRLQKKINKTLRCLVLDFSSVSYVDPSAVNMLQSLTEEFKKIDVPTYIAACPEPIYGMILKCGLINVKSCVRTFPTVHDAVECGNDIFKHSNVSTISRL